VASQLTAEGAILGTVYYIAPEQALGQEVDGRTDLYALGVMLYEWTVGRLPFAGDDPLALIGQHLHALVVPPREHNPEILPALDALIVQLMSKGPEDRPAAAADVRQVLEELARREAAAEVPLDGARQPAFLTEAGERRIERPVFVARERELARLDRILEQALAGQGRVAFVTGGPGRGKTALLDEFARRAMEAHAGLLVASGNCNAYSGVGDPYLPFRDVLGQLTGDIEARWAAGTISQDHALRLWDALPLTVQALVDHGPHVVPALVPGPALLSRANAAAPAGAPWLERLQERVEQQPAHSDGLEQSHLFQQVTHVLRALAEVHPLLLILDDLQWVDTASAGLLFHLGRRLEGSRILVAGTYRPEEVALGRQGGRHPLEGMLAESKRAFGDVWLDLAEVQEPEGQRFVEALLATEPNRLGEGFREALLGHTGGHPLFTVELLRTLQERGDLVQDESGCWVEGATLHWETLPARVEGVIEARIGRLEEELRETLSVASVEGEEFTAQVVARVQELSQRQALRQLSGELGKRHRLVREQPALRVDGRRLSRYRFAHALFQQYLYGDLSDGERALLHGEVAAALEELYEGRLEEAAVRLAWHLSEAGDEGRALKYLTMAGDGALASYAHEEAEGCYRRGLALAPAELEQAHLLRGLGEALHGQSRFQEAIRVWGEGIERYQALEDSDGVAGLYARSAWAAFQANDPAEALRLCLEGLAQVEGAPESPGLTRLLHETARAYALNALLEEGRPFAEQALEMAEGLGDVEAQAHALATLGGFYLQGGDAVEALAQAVELAESNALLGAASRAHNNLGVVLAIYQADYRAAREQYRRAAELERQAGRTAGQLAWLCNVVSNLVECGELQQAALTISQARALLADLSEPTWGASLLLQRELAHLLFRGEWAACAQQARALRASARRRGNDLDMASAGILLARAVLESRGSGRDAMAGEWEEAEAALAEAIEICDRSSYQGDGVEARLWLGSLCIYRGPMGDARRWLAESREVARSLSAVRRLEYLLPWLAALVAGAEGRWAKALAGFEAVAEIQDRHGMRWDWARTLLDWAEAHAARGEPGDRERAVELLRESLSAFEEMGSPGYAELAGDRLQELGATEEPAT
jgi:predicted ATPase